MKWLVFLVSFVVLLTCAPGVFAADEWLSEDIGDTKAGSTDIDGDKITIEANGADIWGAADAFRFVYREVTGDFEISARIVSLERVNEWTKVGLMARQSLDPNSPHVFIHLTADHGVKMIHRDAAGANTGPTPWEKNFDAPVWIKLVRSGNEFSSFWSDDGQDWEAAEVPGTPSVTTVDMTDPILVGIGVTSHTAGVLAEAIVDSVQGSSNLMLPVEPSGSSITAWARVKE